jgi:glycosyltransferase involved in cell wall biosynthesis
MKFSLILSTKGRVVEVERFLRSLQMQTHHDFELIVSDQNEDDRLADALRSFDRGGRLIHLKNRGGVSRARNEGIARASGEIIGFPDDDCAYPPRILEEVEHFFQSRPEYGFLSGRSFADDGKDAVSRHSKTAGPVKRATIHAQCIEFALFIRRDSLGDTRFDENMGVGASTLWHSDEGPDLLLRLEDRGIRGYYDPRFTVWHPSPVQNFDARSIDRSYRYACGSGYFLRKHGYSRRFLAYLTFRALCGAALALAMLKIAKARFFWGRLRGRWRGWKGFGGNA